MGGITTVVCFPQTLAGSAVKANETCSVVLFCRVMPGAVPAFMAQLKSSIGAERCFISQ